MKTIDVAAEFSANPAGRFKADGPYSGERFRDEHLLPALRSGEEVTVLLDGTRGYGSSFLDEAFAGLVREHGFSPEQLGRQLKLVTKRDTLAREIKLYIAEAQPSAT